MPAMRKSSIAKRRACSPGSELALSIGGELRRRRLAVGMSQRDVGDPLTRAFVSAVEHGHVVPSLPSLIHMASRLGTDAATVLGAVNMRSTGVYNPGHGYDRSDINTATTAGGGGRSATRDGDW